MDDGEQYDHSNQWEDDGEAWLSLAQRAERRRLAETLSRRETRRDWADDVTPAGSHYADKTGHKARGLAAKVGATSRARFELRGVPDSPDLEEGNGPFNPLAEDPYNNRGFGESTPMNTGNTPMDSDTGVQADNPMAEKIERKPRVTHDKPTTKPSIAQRNCGGSQR